MSDEEIRAAAEALADDLLAAITAKAEFMFDAALGLQDVQLDETQRLVAETAVQAGMAAAMLVLGERGMLKESS